MTPHGIIKEIKDLKKDLLEGTAQATLGKLQRWHMKNQVFLFY
jgi:ribosomal protein L29